MEKKLDFAEANHMSGLPSKPTDGNENTFGEGFGRVRGCVSIHEHGEKAYLLLGSRSFSCMSVCDQLASGQVGMYCFAWGQLNLVNARFARGDHATCCLGAAALAACQFATN